MVENKCSVSNLGFAGFLIFKGFKLIDKPKKDDGGRFAFFFELDQEECDNLMASYCSSDYCKFDNIIVNLKRMLPRY